MSALKYTLPPELRVAIEYEFDAMKARAEYYKREFKFATWAWVIMSVLWIATVVTNYLATPPEAPAPEQPSPTLPYSGSADKTCSP